MRNLPILAGECVITVGEIKTLPAGGAEFNRAVARLLKSKGAPFVGQLSPKADARYQYEQITDFETGAVTFRWRPKAL